MSYFLFVDESGHDKKASPYEVLAGVAIRDNHLWPLIQEIHSLEDKHFGRRYSAKGREFKAQKILKTKVFRHLALEVEVANQDRRALAMAALDNGEKAAAREFKALAQAKIAFVLALFDLCAHYGCRAFASIVHPSATPTAMDRLRKDYSYLFERFYYFLQDKAAEAASNSLLQGIVVFDELEKTQSHILVGQMQAYFRGTNTGRNRAT
ncbi:MAG: DUF3800 domain-containing protein, partial [Alphaproteobacteria bacterium]|nr:DUF3800 domain-containing protein [Alphaproteobacteria bacterium]